MYVQLSFHCSYILKACLFEEEEREMERRKLKGTYKVRRRKKFFSVFSALFLHCFFFFSPKILVMVINVTTYLANCLKLMENS